MNLNKLLLHAIEASLEAGKKILDIYKSDTFDVEIKQDDSPLTKADKASHNIISSKLTPFNIPILSEEGKQIDYQERKQWKQFWLIDPLDGTKEFIKKNGEFTVNIALLDQNFPVLGVIYAPVLNDLYFAADHVGSYKIHLKKPLKSLNDYIEEAEKLPNHKNNAHLVVASRSHLSEETANYIDQLKKQAPELNSVSKGSSLKLCLTAEGNADVYPRFAPTMEWDIAAGHAIVQHSGGQMHQYPGKDAINYNKENLLNPWFIAISKYNKFKL